MITHLERHRRTKQSPRVALQLRMLARLPQSRDHLHARYLGLCRGSRACMARDAAPGRWWWRLQWDAAFSAAHRVREAQ